MDQEYIIELLSENFEVVLSIMATSELKGLSMIYGEAEKRGLNFYDYDIRVRPN